MCHTFTTCIVYYIWVVPLTDDILCNFIIAFRVVMGISSMMRHVDFTVPPEVSLLEIVACIKMSVSVKNIRPCLYTETDYHHAFPGIPDAGEKVIC